MRTSVTLFVHGTVLLLILVALIALELRPSQNLEIFL
jgi:hypothetical protein